MISFNNFKNIFRGGGEVKEFFAAACESAAKLRGLPFATIILKYLLLGKYVNAPRPKGRGFYRLCEEIAFPISEC